MPDPMTAMRLTMVSKSYTAEETARMTGKALRKIGFPAVEDFGDSFLSEKSEGWRQDIRGKRVTEFRPGTAILRADFDATPRGGETSE